MFILLIIVCIFCCMSRLCRRRDESVVERWKRLSATVSASSMVFVRPADEAPFWGGGVGLDRRHTYHIDGSNDDPAGELWNRPSAWSWLPVRWPVDRASRRARIKGDTRASSVLQTSVELCSAVVKAGCGHNFVEHVLCSINSCV